MFEELPYEINLQITDLLYNRLDLLKVVHPSWKIFIDDNYQTTFTNNSINIVKESFSLCNFYFQLNKPFRIELKTKKKLIKYIPTIPSFEQNNKDEDTNQLNDHLFRFFELSNMELIMSVLKKERYDLTRFFNLKFFNTLEEIVNTILFQTSPEFISKMFNNGVIHKPSSEDLLHRYSGFGNRRIKNASLYFNIRNSKAETYFLDVIGVFRKFCFSLTVEQYQQLGVNLSDLSTDFICGVIRNWSIGHDFKMIIKHHQIGKFRELLDKVFEFLSFAGSNYIVLLMDQFFANILEQCIKYSYVDGINHLFHLIETNERFSTFKNSLIKGSIDNHPCIGLKREPSSNFFKILFFTQHHYFTKLFNDKIIIYNYILGFNTVNYIHQINQRVKTLKFLLKNLQPNEKTSFIYDFHNAVYNFSLFYPKRLKFLSIIVKKSIFSEICSFDHSTLIDRFQPETSYQMDIVLGWFSIWRCQRSESTLEIKPSLSYREQVDLIQSPCFHNFFTIQTFSESDRLSLKKISEFICQFYSFDVINQIANETKSRYHSSNFDAVMENIQKQNDELATNLEMANMISSYSNNNFGEILFINQTHINVLSCYKDWPKFFSVYQRYHDRISVDNLIFVLKFHNLIQLLPEFLKLKSDIEMDHQGRYLLSIETINQFSDMGPDHCLFAQKHFTSST